jgi:hypothetical protein
MMDNPMRHYMNAVTRIDKVPLDEGFIDSIRNWVKGLSDPVKHRGLELTKTLQSQLTNKYGATVPAQVKSANKSWMWGKLSYRDLYRFGSQVMKMSDDEIDRALKNPIVNNNLKQLMRTQPAGTDSPTLPLKSSSIMNNSNPISTTIDKQTKEYLSKAIAVAVIDGMAYIEQEKADKEEKPEQTPATGTSAKPETGEPTPAAPAAPDTPTTSDDIKSAILAIKQGLAAMKGAA